MLKKQCVLWTAVAAVALSACATRTQEPTREQRAGIIAGTYQVLSKESKGAATVVSGWQHDDKKEAPPGQYLHIIHPSHSGKVVALKTLGFLLGGTYQGSSKRDLKGDTLKHVPNRSLPHAYRPVRDYVFANYGTEGKAYLPVYVAGRYLFLVYEKFNGGRGGKYELVSEIEFVKQHEIYGVFKHVCKQDGVLKTLPEWEADNYRQVHETAEKYAKNCAQELLADNKLKTQLGYAFERE